MVAQGVQEVAQAEKQQGTDAVDGAGAENVGAIVPHSIGRLGKRVIRFGFRSG